MFCPFCGAGGLNAVFISGKKRAKERCFMHCAAGCGGFFLLNEYFLSADEQKKRYLLHNNNPADAGYRAFSENFARTALAYTVKLLGTAPQSIFDYGCGSGVLIDVLEAYKKSGVLPHNTEIRGWDPFFAPHTAFFSGGADAVFCLEVAEHFENPLRDFALLKRACRTGGVAAVRTLFAPGCAEDFKRWWYKEDPTHVSFYTQKALTAVSTKAGFEYCGTYNNCSILRAALPR